MCGSYSVVELNCFCLSSRQHYTKQIQLCQEVVEKILNFFVFAILTYTKHSSYNQDNDAEGVQNYGNR